jgi:hypothetical protein
MAKLCGNCPLAFEGYIDGDIVGCASIESTSGLVAGRDYGKVGLLYDRSGNTSGVLDLNNTTSDPNALAEATERCTAPYSSVPRRTCEGIGDVLLSNASMSTISTLQNALQRIALDELRRS